MANIIVELGRKYFEARTAKEEAAKAASAAEAAEGEAKNELIEAMIEAGTNSISIDGIGRLSLTRSVYPNVNAAAKPQFFEYLKASGNGGLLKLDVHTKTLESFLKKHKEELVTQVQDEGLTQYQAECLQKVEQFQGIKAGQVFDEMAAAEVAEAILISQGATIFSKKNISLTKG